MNHIGGVLIVEDDPELGMSLSKVFADLAPPVSVRTAQTVADARLLLRADVPDLVLLDFDLPDGNALDVMRQVNAVSPMPAVIGMSGVASSDQAFDLAMHGVCAYLRKPFGLAHLLATIQQVKEATPELRPVARRLVGRAPLATVEQQIRDVMVEEALARAQGSRRGAARMLSISRQLLQHVLRKRLA